MNSSLNISTYTPTPPQELFRSLGTVTSPTLRAINPAIFLKAQYRARTNDVAANLMLRDLEAGLAVSMSSKGAFSRIIEKTRQYSKKIIGSLFNSALPMKSKILQTEDEIKITETMQSIANKARDQAQLSQQKISELDKISDARLKMASLSVDHYVSVSFRHQDHKLIIQNMGRAIRISRYIAQVFKARHNLKAAQQEYTRMIGLIDITRPYVDSRDFKLLQWLDGYRSRAMTQINNSGLSENPHTRAA